MKAVMLSIRPEWCDLIIQGKKTVELRKTRPKLQTPFKVYIWCTKARKFWARVHGNGWQQLDERIIGEFVCNDISLLIHIGEMGSNNPPELCSVSPSYMPRSPNALLKAACLCRSAAENYLKGRDGYCWHISDLKIYDEPIKLKNFRVKRPDRNGDGLRDVCNPPQSWIYLEEPEVQK